MKLGPENNQLKFVLIITRSLQKARFDYETEELKRVNFEAPSIRAAKTEATKIANALVFLTGNITYDNENTEMTGKLLRWKSWDTRKPYVQENGKKVGWSGKRSENFYENYDPERCTSSCYFSYVTLYWEIAD